MDVEPTNPQRLCDVITSIWPKVFEECFQHLAESIPWWMKLVLKEEGSPTLYKQSVPNKVAGESIHLNWCCLEIMFYVHFGLLLFMFFWVFLVILFKHQVLSDVTTFNVNIQHKQNRIWVVTLDYFKQLSFSENVKAILSFSAPTGCCFQRQSSKITVRCWWTSCSI